MPLDLPLWPQSFPLAGAVYIEYLTKTGHFINDEDSAEALQRTRMPRSGSGLAVHLSRIEWLDSKYPKDVMSRRAMDSVSVWSAQREQSLLRYFQGGFAYSFMTADTAKSMLNSG